MDARSLAIILLGLRLVASVCIIATIIKQIKNICNTRTDYPSVRATVFILTIVLLLGQFTPIILDSVVAFGNLYPGRNASPNILGSSYALSNATKDVIIGALLAFLHYRPNNRDRKR